MPMPSPPPSAALSVWSLRFFAHSLDAGYLFASFMHLVHLPFHEAGHLLFMPFGSLSSLGWLGHDVLLGRLANLVGIALMILALAWGASVVARQHAQRGSA